MVTANFIGRVPVQRLMIIDEFNEGARRNARILTEKLGQVPGIEAPDATKGDHIYVYYPLKVDPAKRDDLRHYLLRRGYDSKTSDMSDCTPLVTFRDPEQTENYQTRSREASILEICVYPVIAQDKMRRLAQDIRAWAGLPAR